MRAMAFEHDEIIYPEKVDERIAVLKVTPERDDDDDDELAALTKFREAVVAVTGQDRWTNNPGFIRDDYFPKYAEGQAEDLYGREVVQTPYFDLDAFEDDLGEGFTDADLGGTTYKVSQS